MVGVIAAVDAATGEIGVERCDDCGVFEGDLDAAWALALRIGGRVWFYQHGEGGDVAGDGSVEGGDANSREFTGAYRDDDCIAMGTDPWIEDGDLSLLPVRPRRT